MSDQPLTRRQMRELERQRALAAGEVTEPGSIPEPPASEPDPVPSPVSAPTPEPAPEPEPEPVPEAESAPARPTAPAMKAEGSRPISRRELRERARALETESETTSERQIARRPVREPTTTSSIPAYGSVHVPLDGIDEEPEPAVEVPPAPTPTEWVGETQVSAEAVPDEPAVEMAAPEQTGQSTPERVSIFGSQPGSTAPAGPAEEVAPQSPAAQSPAAQEPAWQDLVGADEAPATAEPERRGSPLGTVLRYLALVVAFFVIGVLLWIFASGQMGGEPNEPGDGPTTAAHGPVVRGDV